MVEAGETRLASCGLRTTFITLLTRFNNANTVEIKCQLDATDEFLLPILLLAHHVSGTVMPMQLQPANRKHNPQLHTIPTT